MSNFGSEWVAEIVWNPKKQSMLIDSMYRGFYIPPVVFSVHWDTVSQAKVRLCVDGKQRLTAISGFVGGRVRSPTSPPTRAYTLIPPSFRFHVRIIVALSSNRNTRKLTFGRPLDVDRVNRKSFWFKKPKKRNGLEVPQTLKDEFLNFKVRCGAFPQQISRIHCLKQPPSRIRRHKRA